MKNHRFTDLIQENLICEKHCDNIVYRWLKRPCVMYCSRNGILTRENLFYICFQFLDTLKSSDPSDCIFQDELLCIPYAIERVFAPHHYLDDLRQCGRDRFLTVLTLFTLMRLTGIPQSNQLAQYLVNDMGILIPNNLHGRWDSDIYDDIMELLTDSSPIYQQSRTNIHDPDTSRKDSPSLIEYIQEYMKSPRHISEEIAAQIAQRSEDTSPATQQSPIPESPDAQQLKALEAAVQQKDEELQQKDEEIAALKQELDAFLHPAEGYVQIASKCKSKVTALLTAMFYAGYFRGENGLSDRNQVVGYILRYGFHYSTNSIPQLLSAYMTTGSGDLDKLKDELREALLSLFKDALDDLKEIQRN